MSDELRHSLYLLGFIPQLLFALRFLLQWLMTEYRGQSIVPRLFWQLSLTGNVLMTAHGCLQLHYLVSVVQACNAIIAWRNLDLMGAKRLSLRAVIVFLFFAIACVTLLFMWQSPSNLSRWFSSPNSADMLAWNWHIFGALGMVLFSSRFWVQWWQAEREQVSRLSASFWWLSLGGNLILFFYFWELGDPVNWLGPILMLMPILRNLSFILKPRHAG